MKVGSKVELQVDKGFGFKQCFQSFEYKFRLKHVDSLKEGSAFGGWDGTRLDGLLLANPCISEKQKE